MSKDVQMIEQAKGKAMLVWAGKKPLEKIEYYPAQEKEFYGDKSATEFNKLFWGDNLQVLAHLLKEYRGEIDLIYIDPPFDSKADYVKKVKIRGEQINGQQQSLLEEKQYGDIWEKDEYLQFIYERLTIMRELLSETGSIYLHCDWHKNAHIRILMDEIFGEENLVNEIIWKRRGGVLAQSIQLGVATDTIFFYAKNKAKMIFHSPKIKLGNEEYVEERFKYKDENNRLYRLSPIVSPSYSKNLVYEYKGFQPPDNGWSISKEKMELWEKEGKLVFPKDKDGRIQRKQYLDEWEGSPIQNLWDDISPVNPQAEERLDYPTQKPETLIERMLSISTNENALVLDCFSGSGTTLAAAQKMDRRWIGCDINLGAIQTTIKRMNGVLKEQQKENGKLIKNKPTALFAFKVYNVNDYDMFKNELEAKEIVMEMYGVEPIKRSYFDGLLDNNYVKVMPLNRVLNKLDIKTVIKNTEDKLADFTAKKTSKANEATFEEGVLVICSGMELDVSDFLKKENKTGVKIEVRDILTDKQNLIFKQKPEAKIKVVKKGEKTVLTIEEFFSPILIRKLELENQKTLKDDYKAKIKDFRQIIDSVAIDIDYNGKLFNAEIMDLPSKKEVIKGEYEWESKAKMDIAIKIVDVLGEEYFEVVSA